MNRPVLALLDGLRKERTRNFLVFRQPSSSLVVHGIRDDAVDNDIGQLVADELVRPGLVRGEAAFERCFAGIVESTAPYPHAAWRRFYANTLRALRRRRDDHPPGGPIATFEQIYVHAEQLARGRSLLDVGSCFAFFPMLQAATGEMRVTASDANPATVALARRMAREFDLPVAFAIADLMRRLPFGVASFDTVTALHVLEHLPADQSHVALERLCRVARRRVVAAVPLEESPDQVYGHRQSFDLDVLTALASCVPGWRGHAHEHLGGWLVLEPCVAPSRHVGG